MHFVVAFIRFFIVGLYLLSADGLNLPEKIGVEGYLRQSYERFLTDSGSPAQRETRQRVIWARQLRIS